MIEVSVARRARRGLAEALRSGAIGRPRFGPCCWWALRAVVLGARP